MGFRYTRTKVLLPEWILIQKSSLTEAVFLTIVRKYLIRYENYSLINLEGPFAICEREDEIKVNKKRRT